MAPPHARPALAGPVDWRRCLRLGAVGLGLSLVLVLLAVASTPEPDPLDPGSGYTTIYSPPSGRFEVLLNHADGQAYAAFAQDPSVSHPEGFIQGAVGAAPFLPRPFLPRLLWAASAGQRGAIPAAFVAIEALAGGLLVFAGAAILHATGRPDEDRLALALLVLPGSLVTLFWLGQDVLALALAMLGLLAWCRDKPRPVLACLAFTCAGLTRETMLLVVVVVALHTWVRERRPKPVDGLLAVPLVAYLAYSLWASQRYDLRTGRGLTYNLAAPLTGVAEAVPHWGPGGLLLVVAVFALAVAAVLKPRSSLLTWLVVGFVIATAISAERVWDKWESGIRVVLPVAAFALLDVTLPPSLHRLVSRDR